MKPLASEQTKTQEQKRGDSAAPAPDAKLAMGSSGATGVTNIPTQCLSDATPWLFCPRCGTPTEDVRETTQCSRCGMRMCPSC